MAWASREATSCLAFYSWRTAAPIMIRFALRNVKHDRPPTCPEQSPRPCHPKPVQQPHLKSRQPYLQPRQAHPDLKGRSGVQAGALGLRTGERRHRQGGIEMIQVFATLRAWLESKGIEPSAFKVV